MSPCKRGWRTGIFVLILAILNVGAWAQSAPLVKKLEPPNWWVHYTPSLTLLLTGENLNGAQVRDSDPGVSVVIAILLQTAITSLCTSSWDLGCVLGTWSYASERPVARPQFIYPFRTASIPPAISKASRATT